MSAPDKPHPFAVVIRDDDTRLHRHDDIEGAIREAHRLAGNHTTAGFYVLTAIQCVGPRIPPMPVHKFAPIEWGDESLDEIPF